MLFQPVGVWAFVLASERIEDHFASGEFDSATGVQELKLEFTISVFRQADIRD